LPGSPEGLRRPCLAGLGATGRVAGICESTRNTLVEVGDGQAEPAAAAAVVARLLHVATVPDAAGFDRVIGLARP